MPYSRKFSSRRKTYKKRTYKRKSYATKKRAVPLKKMIRREIARNVENKTQQDYVYDLVLATPQDGAVFLDKNIFPVGPDPTAIVIDQGVGQGQRIGNQIKTKKLLLKGTIVPLGYNATTNATPRPMQLKMWIFYDRTDPTAEPNPLTNFFQDGNTSKGFQGDLTDLWSPVNADRYRVLTSRTFKLGYSYYAGSNGAVPNSGNYSNNDFKLNCNFSLDLTKHYPQLVKFQDGQTTPTTRGLFCMFTYASADGSTLALGTIACGVQYMQHYEFEDA